jgi:signal transduction histidine kinase
MVQPEPTDIIRLVRSVLDEFKPLSDEKELKVIFNGNNIQQLMLDPNLMTIIFQNLISNAVKYSKEGGQVLISTKQVNKNESVSNEVLTQDSIVIQVQDDGLGIPAAQKNQIFQKMFRADNVRKTNTDGNGLGLYMIKSLIEHSHGKIWFESEEGKGTIFFVVLPLSGMIAKDGSKRIEGERNKLIAGTGELRPHKELVIT